MENEPSGVQGGQQSAQRRPGDPQERGDAKTRTAVSLVKAPRQDATLSLSGLGIR